MSQKLHGGLEDCMCCKIEILLQHTKSPLEWKRLKPMLMLMKFPKWIFTQVKIHLHTCLALQQPGEKEKHILCQTKDISLCFCGNHHPYSPCWLLIWGLHILAGRKISQGKKVTFRLNENKVQQVPCSLKWAWNSSGSLFLCLTFLKLPTN